MPALAPGPSATLAAAERALATGWEMTGKPPIRLQPATLHRFALARGPALAVVESNVPLATAPAARAG